MALIDKEVLKAQLNNSICGYCDDCGDNCERCKISVVFETIEALPECNAVDCHLLPKGHGDLKDVSKIHLAKFVNCKNYSLHPLHSEDFKRGYNSAIDDVWNVLREAPTIIEADKEADNV